MRLTVPKLAEGTESVPSVRKRLKWKKKVLEDVSLVTENVSMWRILLLILVAIISLNYAISAITVLLNFLICNICDFQHFNLLKNVDMYTFSGEWSEKVYVVCTHLNVDNYGWPLVPLLCPLFSYVTLRLTYVTMWYFY